MNRTPLKPQEQAVLDYIKKFLHDKGYPPSVKEIGTALGIKFSSSVYHRLNKLQTKGLIKRDPAKSGTIDVLEESPRHQKKLMPVPLVGKVTAGVPITAVVNVDDTYPFPIDLTGTDPAFMLSVQGDSMTDAGICDKDYILVRVQHTARNGEIVVAMVGDEEATVKRYYKEKDYIRLQPANSAYEPVRSRDVRVLGKVIGLFRLLSEKTWLVPSPSGRRQKL